MVPSPLKSVLSSGQTESSASVQVVPNGHKELCRAAGEAKRISLALCAQKQADGGRNPTGSTHGWRGATSIPWGCRDLSGGRAIKRNAAQRGQPRSEPEVTMIFSEDNHGAINTAVPVAFNPGAGAVGWRGGVAAIGEPHGDTARGSCPPAGTRVLEGMLRVAALPSAHPVPFPPPLPLTLYDPQ